MSSNSGGIFDHDQQRARLKEIDAISGAGGFWDDADAAQKLMQERGEVLDIVSKIEGLFASLEDAELFIQMAEEAGGDPDSITESKNILSAIKLTLDEMEQVRMLSGPHDTNNAIIVIKPGAGGTESQDWASMLLRMYLRYCEKKKWKVQTTYLQNGEVAGIKTAELLVEGTHAFGFLKAESGVHRLVRLSPFDSAKKRHTSFASVNVMPEIDDDIEIEINDSDLRVDTYRASGAGGQHVNRTDSAVRITHLPTNTVVQCQNERSQHKNRSTAMKLLRSKLYEIELREREEAASEAHATQTGIDFGSQIRSYVLHPDRRIKDVRTGVTINNTESVLDGNLDPFIEAYLLLAGAKSDEGAS